MLVPSISPAVYDLRSDFMALSVFATGLQNTASTFDTVALLDAACHDMHQAPWADAHIEAWRDAYRAFGAKPQRTPPSVDALRKRAVRDGRLPSTNAVVDIYNAISVRYTLPVGGEDADAYQGAPALTRALGGETFDTMQDGIPKGETVDAGEVVWRDERGVTCRRWNWRQGTRTRIELDTTSAWFVLERLEPMPEHALHEAADELILRLSTLCPDATFDRLLQKTVSR
ncbi:hypothetical protein ASE63_25390 [Bosea sp. Root381]|uniref:B3/B4 domain-containing protein n=1 Tax=Bosea sp. Root381 TaxID=1736524 RepID=UPI0006FA4D8D|nr:phenylalanine--tRNA ligase beta subunit-related protein [Bosea sp. Root381]KRE04944.1 hypothetical protein ASE63_25390 [Bosea sp. Root381]